MPYANDAGVVSEWAEGLVKTMTIIVNVLIVAGHTVSQTDTETKLPRTLNEAPLTSRLVTEAARQMYRQTMQFFSLRQDCRRMR